MVDSLADMSVPPIAQRSGSGNGCRYAIYRSCAGHDRGKRVPRSGSCQRDSTASGRGRPLRGRRAPFAVPQEDGPARRSVGRGRVAGPGRGGNEDPDGENCGGKDERSARVMRGRAARFVVARRGTATPPFPCALTPRGPRAAHRVRPSPAPRPPGQGHGGAPGRARSRRRARAATHHRRGRRRPPPGHGHHRRCSHIPAMTDPQRWTQARSAVIACLPSSLPEERSRGGGGCRYGIYPGMLRRGQGGW